MRITDELRTGGIYRFPSNVRTFTMEELTAIADRIDAEHEKAMSRAGQLLADAESDRDYNYANWQDCKQKVLQHNITLGELDARIECLEDELSHCIELPKDADGEYINVGDAVTFGATVWTVTGLKFLGEGWGICCTVYNEQGGSGTVIYPPSDLRHYHAPTVEDVLDEFANAVLSCDNTEESVQRVIAEFAAKFRLINSEE